MADQNIDERVEQLKANMLRLRWSQNDVAVNASQIAAKMGVTLSLSQQSVAAFLSGKAKRIPTWLQFVDSAIGLADTSREHAALTRRALEVLDAHRPPTFSDVLPTRSASDGDGAIRIRQVDLSYAMGDGTNLEDYPEEMSVAFDPNFLRTLTKASYASLFVARGEGDSMQPTLINDDLVLIDTSQRMLKMQDRIWACAVHGAGMIKRLRVIGDQRVEVRSDNPTVGNREVDADDLHIVGRVIWIGRRV